MSDQETFCYHCGQCGALFRDLLGISEERRCPTCGMEPAALLEGGSGVQRAMVSTGGLVTMPKKSVTRSRKLVNRNHLMSLKLVLTWLVLIGLIVLLAKWLRSDDVVSDTRMPEEQYLGPVERLHAQDKETLRHAVPACRAALGDFVAAGNMARRLDLVLKPEEVGDRLKRYYKENAPINVDVDQLQVIGSTVVHLPQPDGDCVLIQWESPDGLRFDSAFRDVGGEWKLDWDHFVRYSEHDWAMFLAGSGPEVAEFRMLARERYASAETGERQYNVMLYAPEMKRFDDAGLKSVISPMPANSTDARMLRAAFRFMREGKPLFRSMMRDINPQDMVRVRVQVRRLPGAGRLRFEVEDVKTCHWYSSDAWGVLPKDSDDDLEGGDVADEVPMLE